MKICALPECKKPVPTHWPNGTKKSEARLEGAKYCGLSHAKIHTHMMGENRGNYEYHGNTNKKIHLVRDEDVDNVIYMKSHKDWFMRSEMEKFTFKDGCKA